VLGIKEGGGQGAGLLDAVARACAGRQVLLVLDNFEHVMAASRADR
jgi:hypothetical protein